MKRCTLTLVLAGLSFGLAPAVHAGGLIHNLPADGSWVVYRAKSEFDLQGNLQSIDRELKLSSVGKAEVDGEPARWIELSTDLGGRKVLAKLLIAEKYLKADENPFEHVSRAWARGSDGEVRELAESRMRQIMIFAASVPHFPKPDKQGKEKIKTELGEFDCERLKGDTEIDGFQDNKIKVQGELWVDNQVPFGLVKAKVKGDLGIGTIETDLVLIKKGSDAKSELPDAK